MRIRTGAITALACALLAPATALAVDYPPASEPGGTTKAPKNGRTLKVCKKGKRCFKTIQKAVNAAKPGDKIRIANGVYHEGVTIKGSKKSFLTLVGNTKNPRKVRIDSKGVHGAAAQNGVLIQGANGVTVDGMSARNYLGNGFFAVNVVGYTFNHVIGEGPKGVYGVYGFNSKGGQILNSEAFFNKDAGFYIGQTPKQTKPRRSIVRGIRSWGNAIGWSGTNMRYVTISSSEFFNNGIGMLPNALDSEKFPPADENVISDNDIFWNNFNYYRGSPFKPKQFGGHYNLPPGLGLVLLGANNTTVQGNRIFGNYLSGFGMIIDFALTKRTDLAQPIGNQITGNDFGLGGNDLNGRDLAYDGTGKLNCFQDNVLRSPTVPADGNTFATCPGPDPNHQDSTVLDEGLRWLNDKNHETYWLKHPHAAHKGYKPLEHWTKNYKPGGDL
jgi:hypothetical protein